MKFVLTEDYKLDDDYVIGKDHFVTIVPYACYNDLDTLCMEDAVSYPDAKFMLQEFFEVIYSKTECCEDPEVVSYSDCVHFNDLPTYLKEHKIEVVE